MPLKIVRDDLVNMRADAIVLPSNEKLVVDGGVGQAVAKRAGLFRVRHACRKLGGCAVGSAVATSAFSFPARHLIHAVGPMWDGSAESARLLRAAYDASLQLAGQLGCGSVAMPLLSAGSFGCPAHVSLSVALASIEAHLEQAETDLDVTLVLFDRKAVSAGIDFLGEIESRIDDAYAESHRPYGTAVLGKDSYERRVGTNAQVRMPMPTPTPDSSMAASSQHAGRFAPAEDEPRMFGASEGALESSYPSTTARFSLPSLREASAADTTAVLEQRFDMMDEGFSSTLLRLIDTSGLTDAQVYRRANMSRQHFSKIRSNVGYRPSKATVLALCVALELDLPQTRDLLVRAGFALSHASKFDIILEYFIEHGIYDQFKINEVLFYFDQPLLGG